MSTSTSAGPRRPLSFLTRPLSVAALLVLALSAWGFNWRQQSQSEPIRAHMAAAARYVQQGRGTDAEREWKEVVRLDPDNAGAWDLLGDYYLTIGNEAEARGALERVWKLQPDTPEIHYRLAVATVQLGDMKAARQHAEAELKLNPNHVGAMDTLTIALSRTDMEQSTNNEDDVRLKYLQRLTELEPRNELYLSRLAEGLVTMRRYAQARPVLEKLVKQNPDFSAARALRGLVLFYTESSKPSLLQAADDLKKAVQDNPTDPIARQYLAKVYLRLRRPKDAVFHLEKLDRLLTAKPSYLFDLATAHQMLGHSQKARQLRERYASIQQQTIAVERLKTRLSNSPNDFDSVLGIGLLLLESDQPTSAHRYLQSAAKLRPQDPRPQEALRKLERLYVQHLNAAHAALQRRDLSQAGRHIAQVMLLLPDDQRTAQVLNQFKSATSPTRSSGSGRPSGASTPPSTSTPSASSRSAPAH